MIIDVYRATANFPLCIEGDPSDTLAHRDDGFIQICARGKQQIYDTILQAPCLGMHPEVMTPDDAGLLRHQGQPPQRAPHRRAGPRDPRVPGPLDPALPAARADQRRHRDRQLRHLALLPGLQGRRRSGAWSGCSTCCPQIGADFERHFGRPGLSFFDAVGLADRRQRVDIAVVGMGPDFGTFEALRAGYARPHRPARSAGIAMRLLTPFPRDAVRERLAGARGGAGRQPGAPPRAAATSRSTSSTRSRTSTGRRAS